MYIPDSSIICMYLYTMYTGNTITCMYIVHNVHTDNTTTWYVHCVQCIPGSSTTCILYIVYIPVVVCTLYTCTSIQIIPGSSIICIQVYR